MNNTNTCLISKDHGKLQIPYADYVALVEKAKQAQRMREVRDEVIANLSGYLGGKPGIDAIATKVDTTRSDTPAPQPVAPPPAPEPAPVVEPTPVVTEQPAPEKVSVEFEPEAPVAAEAPVDPVAPAKKAPAKRELAEGIDVPPIKKDISVHFNNVDASGRIFSVFKQYYTCLNDTCGGTVRVTMKDGFCSLWNYDEWEEFAFIDIFEGQLRIAVDPRYTDALKSLDFCEVPRLLSSRRNLVCVKVDDLNNTMLEVLAKAFEEVGLTAS